MHNTLFFLSDIYSDGCIPLDSSIDIEKLFGQIVSNRIVNTSLKNIEPSHFSSEVIKAITIIAESNREKCRVFIDNLTYLSRILSAAEVEYALLKGAYLTPFLYSFGERTSNDIDILTNRENLSKIQQLLQDEGFIQGMLVSSKHVRPATRKEIIESRMNNGETIPFLKEIDGNWLEVDINLSLDFKPTGNRQIVTDMLSSSICVSKDALQFNTLNHCDFLIHLCCHLYKEATTYDWVIRRRDLMLYKFSDINVFTHKHGNEKYFNIIAERIKLFGLERECYYTFENASIIYPSINKIEGFIKLKEEITPNNLAFMTQIVWPREKRLFQHSMKFVDWFFCDNRIAMLEEIPYEAD